MSNVFKKMVMVDVPLFAVVGLCALTGFASAQLFGQKPNGKYLVAEKSAVILQAVFDRQGESQMDLEKEVAAPILAVLKKYADEGYVVIDTSKDENGNMTIAALPNGTRNITTELTAAVAKKKAPQ